MPALLALLIPAFAPVIADGVRGLIGMITGGAGARPANVDEAIKLNASEIEKLKALAQLDQPAANISPWVANLRASFRYLAAAVIILGTLGLTVGNSSGLLKVDPGTLQMLLDMTGSVFAFMFGDRMYLSLKGGK